MPLTPTAMMTWRGRIVRMLPSASRRRTVHRRLALSYSPPRNEVLVQTLSSMLSA